MNVALKNPSHLTACSTEWASRPADERFTSLPALHDAMQASRDRAKATAVSSRGLIFEPHPENPRSGLQIVSKRDAFAPSVATNWSFNQMSRLAGAPASYLNKLPAPIAADCLNYGLRFDRDIEDVGVLVSADDDSSRLRAATGPNYGRVWNSDITGALMDRFGDGRTGDWRIPGEFGKDVVIGKHNTTLYGSDRDMFVFLADEKNRVQVANRRNGQPGDMARGFFVWNSEVGAKSLGVAFFLFDFVCMNRIVWGVKEYTEKRLRHTVGAPDRWLDEVAPIMLEYSMSSAMPVEQTIKAAQERKLDDVDDFLAKRFSPRQATQFQSVHEMEEGRPIETIWDAVAAITATAREMPNNDTRVELEKQGGALLDLVAV